MLPCAHCEEAPREQDGLCHQCAQYPRCIGCGVIFGIGTSVPFTGGYCESCYDFEHHIKANCICCGRPKPTTISYFRRNGNFCIACSTEALKHAANPTLFTQSEYNALIRFLIPEDEGADAPQSGYSPEVMRFVSGGGGRIAHAKMARIYAQRTRIRIGIHDTQSDDTEGDPPKTRVRRHGA